MKNGNLIIETREYNYLKQIMSLAKYHKDHSYKASIDKLQNELKNAHIVPHRKMPADVVRLNSWVTIRTPYAVERTYQIVKPEKGDIKKNRISLLAPMGLALFGYAEGDRITWTFPMGESKIKIKKVSQPQNTLMNCSHDKQNSETP